jgi:hypothetical protein
MLLQKSAVSHHSFITDRSVIVYLKKRRFVNDCPVIFVREDLPSFSEAPQAREKRGGLSLWPAKRAASSPSYVKRSKKLLELAVGFPCMPAHAQPDPAARTLRFFSISP